MVGQTVGPFDVNTPNGVQKERIERYWLDSFQGPKTLSRPLANAAK